MADIKQLLRTFGEAAEGKRSLEDGKAASDTIMLLHASYTTDNATLRKLVGRLVGMLEHCTPYLTIIADGYKPNATEIALTKQDRIDIQSLITEAREAVK